MKVSTGIISVVILCNIAMASYAEEGESQCKLIKEKITNANCVLGPKCTAIAFKPDNALSRRQLVMKEVQTNLYALVGPAIYPAMSTSQDKKLNELGSALSNQNQVNALVAKISTSIKEADKNFPESGTISLKSRIKPSTKLSEIINVYSQALSRPCKIEKDEEEKS